MAANIQLNEGTSGKYAKTTEVTSGIHLGNTQLTNSSGTEVGTLAAPIAIQAGTGIAIPITDNAGSVTVDGAVTVTNATASNLKAEVTNAGTFAVQAAGSVADDATTPPNPQMIGGSAVETDGTDPTSVSAEADVSIARTTRDRRILVCDFSPRLGTANTTETSAQTDKELIAAPGAGLSLYITDVVVSNGATSGSVKFEEATAGAKTVKIPLMYLSVNGGAVLNFRTPIRLTANTNFGFTSATVTTHTILVNYFIAP